MIGLVLVTHGHLADEFRSALGACGRAAEGAIETISIGPDDDMDNRRQDIMDAVTAGTDDGNGVIILTDMFGGTPSNLSISVMSRGNTEVIAGMNLPMLIKLAGDAWREQHAEGARRGVGCGPQIYLCRQPRSFRKIRATMSVGGLERELLIINKRGLHARASAKFVQTVETFDAEIHVSKDGMTVGGTSIMGLMMLAAGPGSTIMVTSSGNQAQEALDTIEALIADKFGEEM